MVMMMAVVIMVIMVMVVLAVNSRIGSPTWTAFCFAASSSCILLNQMGPHPHHHNDHCNHYRHSTFEDWYILVWPQGPRGRTDSYKPVGRRRPQVLDDDDHCAGDDGQQCFTQHQPLGQRSRAKLRKQTLCGAQTILSRLQDKVYDKPNVSVPNESWDLVLANYGKSSTNVFSKVTSQSQGCPHNGVERRSSLCKVISIIIGVVVMIVIITIDTIQTKTQLLQKLN